MRRQLILDRLPARYLDWQTCDWAASLRPRGAAAPKHGFQAAGAWPLPGAEDDRAAFLWFCDLDDPQAAALDATDLSVDEAQTVERIADPLLRQRARRSRAALRNALGSTLGVSTGQVAWNYAPLGKPRLVASLLGHQPLGFDFNLSHADGLWLFGFTRRGWIGVDIEVEMPGAELLDMAAVHFGPQEQQQLKTLPAKSHTPAFYRAWTLKEALLKANGRGLSGGTNTLSVEWNANGTIDVARLDVLQAAPAETSADVEAIEWTYYQDDIKVGSRSAWLSIVVGQVDGAADDSRLS